MNFKSEAGEGEVSALARGLAVLRVVADFDGPAALKEISDLTGIPKPTTSRLVGTLVTAGLMRKTPNSEKFELGPGVMSFATAFLSRMDFRALAKPHMLSFAERVGVSVHLGVRDGLEMVLIESVRPLSAAIVMRIGIGGRLGLASSAIGRAYMAALDESTRNSLIAGLQVTGSSRASEELGALESAIAHFRANGYTISLGQWHPDINAIAIPIVMPDGEIYAMNCGGPAYKLPERVLRETIAPGLIACANAIVAESGAALST